MFYCNLKVSLFIHVLALRAAWDLDASTQPAFRKSIARKWRRQVAALSRIPFPTYIPIYIPTYIPSPPCSKAVCCTYWANRLQTFPAGAPNLFVTLNPTHTPAPETVHRQLVLAHPVFSAASVAAQERVPSIQVGCGVWRMVCVRACWGRGFAMVGSGRL